MKKFVFMSILLLAGSNAFAQTSRSTDDRAVKAAEYQAKKDAAEALKQKTRQGIRETKVVVESQQRAMMYQQMLMQQRMGAMAQAENAAWLRDYDRKLADSDRWSRSISNGLLQSRMTSHPEMKSYDVHDSLGRFRGTIEQVR